MNDVILFLLIWLCSSAAYFEAKCLRDPHIPDNSYSISGRKIKIVAYVFLTLRFIWAFIEGVELSWLGIFSVLLLALSDVMRCTNRLELPKSTFSIQNNATVEKG